MGSQQTHPERRKNQKKTPFLLLLRRTHLDAQSSLGPSQIESAYDEDSLRPAIDHLIAESSILKTDGKGMDRQAAQDRNCVHEYVVAMKDPELAHTH